MAMVVPLVVRLPTRPMGASAAGPLYAPPPAEGVQAPL